MVSILLKNYIELKFFTFVIDVCRSCSRQNGFLAITTVILCSHCRSHAKTRHETLIVYYHLSPTTTACLPIEFAINCCSIYVSFDVSGGVASTSINQKKKWNTFWHEACRKTGLITRRQTDAKKQTNKPKNTNSQQKWVADYHIFQQVPRYTFMVFVLWAKNARAFFAFRGDEGLSSWSTHLSSSLIWRINHPR